MLATRLRQILEGPILLAGDSVPDLFERPERARLVPWFDSDSAPVAPSTSEDGAAELRESLPDLKHG